MLRNLLPLFALFFVSSAALAQVPSLPKPVLVFMKKTMPTSKTNSQAYRLIAETNLEDEGSGFGLVDSTTYEYNSNGTNAYDSSYTYQWMGSSWEPQTLEVNLYNAQGQPVNTKSFYFAGPGWEQDGRGVATYDANGNVLTLVYEQHDGSAWDTTFKLVNVYQNNRPVEETMYQNQGSGLEPFIKTLYHYNAQGLADTVETQMNMGSWIGMDLNVYTYNAAGKVLTQTNFGGDFMGGFEPSEQYTYSYNQRNDLVTEQFTNWNGISWENVSRTHYQVNAQSLLLDWLEEGWDGNDWYEDRQGLNFHTGSRLDSTLMQQKQGSNWVNLSSTSFGYDAPGNITLTKDYEWNGGAWELTAESRKYYEAYNGPTGIADQPSKLEGLSVYPNPIESVASFSFVAERDGMAALAIYDLAGRQLFAIGAQATAGQNIIHWDANSLPAGSYIYKIKVDGKTASGVLVK